MKKYLNILAISFLVAPSALTFVAIGQTRIDFKSTSKEIFKNLDSLGRDGNASLTSFESEYFNQIFSAQRHRFDFTNKTIAFLTGSNGGTHSNKQRYFDLERDRISREYSLNGGRLITFNEIEKEQSGGYDAVILYWSKIIPTKKKIVKTIRKHGIN